MGRTKSFVYNSMNLVTSSTDPERGVTAYGYDANGNLTSAAGNKTATITPENRTSGATYDYDDENRLVRVETTGSNPQVITYAYDLLGRRIEKNVNGTITRYLYDREDILLEYDQAGTVIARYIHGPGIDEPLAMEKNSPMYYYHADGLGSIIALTNSTGGVVQAYQYDAFGNIMSGTSTSRSALHLHGAGV